jgi:hypothetical protein
VKLPGRAWRIIHQLQRIRWDIWATLKGYCNHCPNDGTPGTGGGYTFWRCGRRRGHQGLHRAFNYVWTPDGATDYLPLPYGHPESASQPRAWFRAPGAMTRRQRRNRAAWRRQNGYGRSRSFR